MRNIILVLLVLFCAANAPAAVWRVEKNGSGDFTIIQHAVDASASGDTILIGPGRYDDRFLWGNPPWQQHTRVLVTRSDLTLIGAGADRTIIGDAAPMGIGYDQDSGLAAHVAFGAGVEWCAGTSPRRRAARAGPSRCAAPAVPSRFFPHPTI